MAQAQSQAQAQSRAGLPDPTADLQWSNFVGAIHDIFGQQAEAHPDRVCVVETASSTTPERRFTYREVYEATNTLAHYLHDSGVTNGDVVMIWAHRSVDLVVSLMGTLAAGATMTVLDPAYPPARQQIYLEVSQPRALIRIGRATDENGPLAPLVQKYIDEQLQLKAEVPELRLHDGGLLSGSSGHDIFEKARQSATVPPPVVVGPDSNPTLSFTSGSEGRPKGVLGRHYSLTRYFPWMAKRFNLSADSRFTMLSGLAHDPIQRDVFTPLFMGAQLLVPAKEDIQHEKLAEWFREHKPTVTHLTPAMGQILVGGATAEFPSLEQVFFVGDVLTTRDCRSLRRLAINATIQNMFGSTETQRAVSYYEVPSRANDPDFLDKLKKDTIPAGRGMENVQLLILNTEDHTKLCGIGETGEIWVRAAGLAEMYLGDSALNEKKFVPNCFVDNQKWVEQDRKDANDEPWRRYYKGPRDRMYRTGDLGRYLESGDVDVIGRADDSQIKIRGFRIELNEIDSNLSQHPLIRDCKTLVRRNRDEEQTLVSYIVPEAAEWRRRAMEDIEDEGIKMGPVTVFQKKYRMMQKEVREHLKSRLPAYAVPTIYLVLDKLPLNPNGKVDKPNLPFPDVAERVEEASEEDMKNWESLTEMQRTVAQKWADLVRGLNPKSIRPEDSFFDLGGHSLLAQQLLLNFRKELQADLTINNLYSSATLAGFTAEVEKQLKKASGVPTEESEEGDPVYAQSLDALLAKLPTKYHTADLQSLNSSGQLTVFLTGATGFLGSYLVKDILERTRREIKLIAHVRAVKDAATGLDRLKRALGAYGLWKDDWLPRLSCVIGDLSQPNLGMNESDWQRVVNEADVVIHNGATVHWVKTYQDMMASNVLSTLDAMALCNEGKPKIFSYVSSTSVLDNDHYIKLSSERVGTGQGAIYESDDMDGSRRGLGTGYGQTKWVSEKLVREAGNRGLIGSVIRPGYILGDILTGVCNTDDFLIRMLKGCVQLKARPRIVNTVNAVGVNHVARVVVASALNPIPHGVHVVHVTAHPRFAMNEYLSIMEYYGYKAPEVSYDDWKLELEKFVSAGTLEKDQEQHALMPLFHFCMNDLPANTRAPFLDDRNAVAVLKADAENWTGLDESFGHGIGRDEVGRYLGYLAKIGFIALPSEKGRPLPEILVDAQAVGGRGGVA